MPETSFFRFAVLIAMLLAAPIRAELVPDQEQPHFDVELGDIAIGGNVQQRLAQSVTAGVDGRLAQIHLPIACFPAPAAGTLVLEIVELDGGVPSDRVMARVEVPGTTFPELLAPEFRSIALPSPVRMSRGQQFAFTLANPTGECWLIRAIAGDSYGGGEGFFTNLNDDPNWIAMKGRPEPSQDLAFKTFVDVPGGGGGGSGGLCSVRGLRDPVPIPSFVPLCRCLQDDFLREQRCTLMHPSFLLFRRIPWPIQPGAAIKVRWTLVPFERLGPVRIEDNLPEGFFSPSTELLFDGAGLEVGQSLTLQYDALGGSRPGSFRMETDIAFGQTEGVMSTRVEVAGKKR
ncbi:MAG TPA: hypothetical protein VM557_09295 [Thermoanaerobaculia bacterium]|nr:hypothetical protein [Thermoanaerobaculia bacterium]